MYWGDFVLEGIWSAYECKYNWYEINDDFKKTILNMID